MKALTVQQPFAWAIINAGKDVENRDWKNRHCTGTIAIHVGLGRDYSVKNLPRGVNKPSEEELKREKGFIIGVVEIDKVVESYQSKWRVDTKYAWVLKNPRKLPRPIKYTGERNLWEVKPSVVRAIKRQLSI